MTCKASTRTAPGFKKPGAVLVGISPALRAGRCGRTSCCLQFDFFDLLGVVLHQLEFGAGHDAMIGTGQEAAQRHQRAQTLQLCVHSGLVLAEGGLIHGADTAHFLAELAARGRKLVTPGADLDREHDVDAALKPDGQQAVGHAVADERNQVDSVLFAQFIALYDV